MEISKLLRDAGLKVTQQRRIIYESMRKLEHCSMEKVINDVTERHPDISVATIYRIMESFSDAGLLLKFAGPQGRSYFDITPNEHLHFFTSDDRVLDIDDADLDDMIRQRLAMQLPLGQCIDKVSMCVTIKSNINLT